MDKASGSRSILVVLWLGNILYQFKQLQRYVCLYAMYVCTAMYVYMLCMYAPLCMFICYVCIQRYVCLVKYNSVNPVVASWYNSR